MQLLTPSEKAAVQVSQISVVKELVDALCESVGVVNDLEKSEFTVFSVLAEGELNESLFVI